MQTKVVKVSFEVCPQDVYPMFFDMTIFPRF